MGIVSAMLRGGPERRSMLVTPQDLADIISERSASGRNVSEEKALAQTTVLSCVQLIAESVGMIPCLLYERLDRGKERAGRHTVYTILHEGPNPEMTPMELFENIAGHLALWGNAYCEIEYDGAGHRRAVWLLRPDRMRVGVNDRNERTYLYSMDDGREIAFPRYKVWHVRGWGTDAWLGKSRIMLARDAIGLALATEEYGSRLFRNNSRPGGAIKITGKLSAEGAKRFKDDWEAAYSGDNIHRVAVLSDGAEWQQIGIPPEEAQFLETRAFQQTQICGLFRVPPHMIGIVENSTSWGTGIGQQTQGFVTFCLGAYLKRISQSAERDLLSANERKVYFVEHLSSALVQNDLQARYQAYSTGRMGGWLSVNDIRELENMNPVADGDGYLQPLNYAPLGSEPAPAPEPEPVVTPDDSEEDDDETQND